MHINNMYVCTTAKHAGKKREMEVLASFRSEARGVHFYDFRPEDIVVGLRFCCERELLNAKDPSSILLRCGLSGTLGHLGREASAYLAPLLDAGLVANG